MNEQIAWQDLMYLLDAIQNITQKALINHTFFPSDLMVATEVMNVVSTCVGSMENAASADVTSVESLLQVATPTGNLMKTFDLSTVVFL